MKINPDQLSLTAITDPRDLNKRHKIIDIINIAICAVVCGADSWEHIEEFGHSKYGWFKDFLELLHGIPSHDTFGRVFARIDPVEFQQSFISWVQAICRLSRGQIVWVLGISFREDESRIRKDNAPENFAVLRHMALNLLKRETSLKKSIKAKRLKAGWDNDYLAKVLYG